VKIEEKSTNSDIEPSPEGSSPDLYSYAPFSGSVETSKSIRFPQQIVTDEGIEISIRPVRPDDVALLKSLFESLSPESIYFRFFAPIKDFPDHMLESFARINEDCEIALTALDRSGKMLGICCIAIMEDGIRGEFAVLIGDPWHGKGIGAELLKHCLSLAKDRRVEVVWGRVLPGNTKMLALGRKLGFTLKQVPDDNEYELLIDLRKKN